MNRIIESNVLDCISAEELMSALKQLKTLSKIEAAEQRKQQMADISFSQQKQYPIEQRGFKSKGKKEASMSFQLYQSKRLQQKAQKTTRKRTTKPQLPLVRQVKANPKSQSIIRQKQQKGQAWLPIHLRTKKDLEKKKQNIQKIRNMLQNSKTDQNIKQCTFKPKLNPVSEQYITKSKYSGHINNNIHTLCSNNYKKQNKQNIMITSQQIQSALAEKKQYKAKSVTPRKPLGAKEKTRVRINTQTDDSQYFLTARVQQNRPKPKNKSFNMLLDLIK